MTELTHFFHTLCLFLFPLFPPTTQRPLFHLVWIFSIDCLQVINLAFHSVVLFRYCIFSSKNPLSVDMNTLREGNGTPLQYSCLENPRDRGACWAAVYGVTGSRTRLTRLSSSSSNSNLRKCSSHGLSQVCSPQEFEALSAEGCQLISWQ